MNTFKRIEECIDYIIEHEYRDYRDFCLEGDHNFYGLKTNESFHIYPVARLARLEVNKEAVE